MGQTLASAQSHQKQTPRRLPPRYSLGGMSLAKPTQLKGFRAVLAPAQGQWWGMEVAVHSLWWDERDVSNAER